MVCEGHQGGQAAAGTVNVVTSSKESTYDHVPEVGTVDEDNAFLHITSNNTIFGTQYATMPESNVPGRRHEL